MTATFRVHRVVYGTTMGTVINLGPVGSTEVNVRTGDTAVLTLVGTSPIDIEPGQMVRVTITPVDEAKP